MLVYFALTLFSLHSFNQLNTDGILPVSSGRISSGYDDISDFRAHRPHQGIDFSAPIVTEVVASFSGGEITLLAADKS
ncbi:hypothetical protein [Colwellia sp. MT41]|uniref:hypothetical protein n=1 Tax=Colwellia sp. MT41 TaxID=58049 RepID=UPI0012F9875E|nr:hypothetical protein [Colwellia sp. MT41]